MELSKNDTRVLKGVGIIFMVILHLFARKEVNGLYETLILIDGVPLAYYIGHFGDACRPIYLFASGYAFYIVINQGNNFVERMKKNAKRVVKLLINYWIVLILFVLIGFLVGKEMYPGSLTDFLLNFFVLSNSYNGAWWFLQVYILIVIFSPIIVRLVKKYNAIPIIMISGCIYSISYLQFYRDIFELGDSVFMSALVRTTVLIGTSLFSFLIGSIFAKEKVFTQLHKKFYEIKFRNTLCYLGIIMLIIIHSIFESASIAPLTGISFICFFVFIDKSKTVKRILNIFAEHSTNIWLTHMFFYMTIFPSIIFAPKYPALILVWLFVLCIVTSYIIKFMYDPIVSFIDNDRRFLSYDRKVVKQKV